MGSVIRRRLDLVLHLMDTTTGYSVNEALVTFDTDRLDLKFIPKGDGTYILIDAGRENFLMQITVKGYEKTEVFINYEELNEISPLKQVFLIPSEKASLMENVLFMRGNLPKLRNVTLIETNKVIATTNAYDQKKKLIKIFEGGYRLNTEGSSYAILNRENRSFEVFEIGELADGCSIKVKAPLKEEFQRNSQICRVINGYVYSNGDYLIAVRDDNANKPAIIRFETDEVTFLEVDFKEINKINSDEESLP